MKKGNYYPKARARWVYGRYYVYGCGPPTWIRPCSGTAVFLTEILGIPTPVSVHYYDMSPGQWKFVPSVGALLYEGIWFDEFGSQTGYWRFAAGNEAQGLRCSFSLHADFGFGDKHITIYNETDFAASWYSAGTCNSYYMYSVYEQDLPWVGIGGLSMRCMDYDEIRAWGANPDDTAPLTWTDPG